MVGVRSPGDEGTCVPPLAPAAREREPPRGTRPEEVAPVRRPRRAGPRPAPQVVRSRRLGALGPSRVRVPVAGTTRVSLSTVAYLSLRGSRRLDTLTPVRLTPLLRSHEPPRDVPRGREDEREQVGPHEFELTCHLSWRLTDVHT